jgi:uncharacterized protein
MGGNIPTREQCLNLMEQYGMLANIRAHSLLVTGVAEVLLNGLMAGNTSGVALPEKELVQAGALLHDIAKTICLNQDCLHAQKGRDICLEHGYPAIGEIVCEHVLLNEFSPERYAQGIFYAKEIVYYADKRVCHDIIVSIEDRLAYILERYGNNDEERFQRIKENFRRCRILEDALFSRIDFAPEELADRVADSGRD